MASGQSRLIWTAISLAGFGLLWAAIAAILQSRVLPGPLEVWQAYLHESTHGNYWYHMLVTLARVAAAFTLSMLIGSAIGIALGRSDRADRFFGGWLTLFLNLPALVTMILCYVWFGLTEAAAIAAVSTSIRCRILFRMLVSRPSSSKRYSLPSIRTSRQSPLFCRVSRSNCADSSRAT